MKKVLIFAILVNCITACQNSDNKISEKPKTQISKTILSSDERLDRQTKVEALQNEFKSLVGMENDCISKGNHLKKQADSLLNKIVALKEQEIQLQQELIENLKNYNKALKIGTLTSIKKQKINLVLKEKEFKLDKIHKECFYLDSCSKSKNNEAEDFYVKSNQFRSKADKIDEQMALLFVN